MKVRLLAHIPCGWTRCDIHGDHEAQIRVEIRLNVVYRPYNLYLESECFGDEQHFDVARHDALDILNRWSSIPHTRRAYTKFRSIEKAIDDGAFVGEWTSRQLPMVNRLADPPPRVDAATIYAQDSLAGTVNRSANFSLDVGDLARLITERFANPGNTNRSQDYVWSAVSGTSGTNGNQSRHVIDYAVTAW